MGAARGLHDFGTNIPICNLARVKSGLAIDDVRGSPQVSRLGSECDGVIYLTCSLLVASKTDGLEDRDQQNN